MNTLSHVNQRLFVTTFPPKSADPELLLRSSRSTAALTGRRRLIAVLAISSWLALLTGAGHVLGDQGFSAVDLLLLAFFAVGTPWTVLGFWNSAIGFVLMRMAEHGAAGLKELPVEMPLRDSTAVVMTLRNENTMRALGRLRAIKDSLDATGHGRHFH